MFVKQFRPPVFLSRICEAEGEGAVSLALGNLEIGRQSRGRGHLGVTIELCAGIVDKVRVP